MDTELIIFIVGVIILLIAGYVNQRRCPQCNTKLKLDKINNPWGINITKTASISFLKYADVDEYYVCPRCSKKYFRKHDTKELQEI